MNMVSRSLRLKLLVNTEKGHKIVPQAETLLKCCIVRDSNQMACQEWSQSIFCRRPSIGTLAGNLLFIVLFAMPDLKGLQAGMVEWRVVIANMPWAVLLVYGGAQCMNAAFKVSGLAATISDFVLELQFMDPTISQLILTLIASVLTEVMDNTGTCAILVPPSARLAEMSQVDPVYFALPVTVAASTSLVMPASNLAITVVISYADITVSDLTGEARAAAAAAERAAAAAPARQLCAV
ncbi:hypothetical protein HPB47_004009 [Ixodes persulcatus]|uniref:Uncharacterized protein n=1 Tax=Ixodes persulcatus TaxID=34615 RepID=A0AC60PGZ7_IXOPE|nr:hypothetical protein HPB47_004009 [Ixodes persulcatus]